MNSEAKKSRNEYYRNWRAKNRDKVKAAQDRYWSKRAAEMAKKEDDKNGGNEYNSRDCQKS